MTREECRAKIIALRKAEEAAGAKMFLGIPDRWYEDLHFRCRNDHVSTMYLKCEAKGYDACFACGEPVSMTFPEDKDGPLV
jgi:hypothetical protein